MSIKVTSEITVYEEDGKDASTVGGPTLRVHSHFAYSDRVVLQFGDKSITVVARDLEAATTNATRRGSEF